jgi:hypothetical protein
MCDAWLTELDLEFLYLPVDCRRRSNPKKLGEGAGPMASAEREPIIGVCGL